MSAEIDIAGKTFGKLTAVSKHARRTAGEWLWLCKCACGREHVVRASHLRYGLVQSCGCGDPPNLIHGLHKSPEYMAWSNMVQRCTNEGHPMWPTYGGRGIKVCERWRTDFAAFFADVGPRPSSRHSLDRYPNNATGSYEPGNVRWATREEQANNTRANRIVDVGAGPETVAQACRRLGVSRKRVRGPRAADDIRRLAGLP